jgi:large subunit ribosomal protein L5
MTNFKKLYNDEIFFKLEKEFLYKNKHQIPKLKKIVVNMGLGLNSQNKQNFKKAIEEIRTITGQHPIIRTAKKSISGFKIRQGMILGLSVTLRKEKMYSFFEKLCKLVLPRIRDFQGLNLNSFDKHANYNLGISDQFLFPELENTGNDERRGFDITLVTSANTTKEAIFLLKEFGFPFKKE